MTQGKACGEESKDNDAAGTLVEFNTNAHALENFNTYSVISPSEMKLLGKTKTLTNYMPH